MPDRKGLAVHVAILSPMISPLAEPVAGGTEAVTAHLAQGLAERGHRVTVFATEGSRVDGCELVTCGVAAASLRWPGAPEALNGATMRSLLVQEQEAFTRIMFYLRAHAQQFDLLHNHSFSGFPFLLSSLHRIPMVTTLHVPPILLEQIAALRTFSAHGLAPSLTAVSEATAHLYAPIAPIATIVPNGVDVPRPLPVQTGQDLLFVGRMVPEKGVDLAISIARGAERRLLLAGRIEDEAYFQQVVAPLVDGKAVCYLGHLSQAEVWQVMATAYATLFTPRWPEPCSLAVLESMARGTPVIGFRSGGLPEQVVDGTTGFLVDDGDVAGAIEAVARVGNLRRSDCISHVRNHFSTGRMIDLYLACYRRMLGDDTV